MLQRWAPECQPTPSPPFSPSPPQGARTRARPNFRKSGAACVSATERCRGQQQITHCQCRLFSASADGGLYTDPSVCLGRVSGEILLAAQHDLLPPLLRGGDPRYLSAVALPLSKPTAMLQIPMPTICTDVMTPMAVPSPFVVKRVVRNVGRSGEEDIGHREDQVGSLTI